MLTHQKFALGTELVSSDWHGFVSAKAMCADGKVRKVCRIAASADTFFSVPAAVRVRGKYVTGYLTVTTVEGYDTEASVEDPYVVKFRIYSYGKNADALPAGEWLGGDSRCHNLICE